MIFADKLIRLRKKEGWSQEELAEKLNVSRQSVSKWESAASVPELDKILTLSRLFGVSTDYLLKDDQEDVEYSNESDSTLRRVSITEANEYMEHKAKSGKTIGLGVLMCIISPVTLIALTSVSELSGALSEAVAVGIGLGILLLLVAGAVALFITTGIKGERFRYIEEEDFEPSYGVEGLAEEKLRAFSQTYTISLVSGVCLCILAVIPLIVVSLFDDFGGWVLACVCLLLVLVAVAVYLIIWSSSVKESFKAILQQDEYGPGKKERAKTESNIGGIYWPVITVAYLALSFITKRWELTWIIWPAAGVLYGVVSSIVNSIKR